MITITGEYFVNILDVLRLARSGIDFTNILQALQIAKAQKRSQVKQLFALSGSEYVKADGK